MQLPSLVIALVGMPAAGKTTIAQFLANSYGFRLVRTREIVRQLGANGSTSSLQDKGLELSRDEGANRFVDQLMTQLDCSGPVVVDSLRPVAHLELLREAVGDRLKLVAVSAPAAIREARLVAREGGIAQVSDRDLHPVEAEVGELIARSMYHLVNIEYLERRIEGMLAVVAWTPPLPSMMDTLASLQTTNEREALLHHAANRLSTDRGSLLTLFRPEL